MKNIVLIGMPGAGKSTIGVVLAKVTGYEFIDSDLMIQKREKRLLSQIIKEEGLNRFIEIEGDVNRNLEAERAIIATGGSAVYDEDAMIHFKETSTIAQKAPRRRNPGGFCLMERYAKKQEINLISCVVR